MNAQVCARFPLGKKNGFVGSLESLRIQAAQSSSLTDHHSKSLQWCNGSVNTLACTCFAYNAAALKESRAGGVSELLGNERAEHTRQTIFQKSTLTSESFGTSRTKTEKTLGHLQKKYCNND